MHLEETIGLMTSNNYEDQFIAEYEQLKERYDKLKETVDNWDTITHTPKCSVSIYQSQLSAMKQYLKILELRGRVENINLNK